MIVALTVHERITPHSVRTHMEGEGGGGSILGHTIHTRNVWMIYFTFWKISLHNDLAFFLPLKAYFLTSYGQFLKLSKT